MRLTLSGRAIHVLAVSSQDDRRLNAPRDEHGQVVVSREFGGLGFRCKEIVFSVDTAKKSGLERAFYTANICSDGKDWRWASAEPTTRRWGGLQ